MLIAQSTWNSPLFCNHMLVKEFQCDQTNFPNRVILMERHKKEGYSEEIDRERNNSILRNQCKDGDVIFVEYPNHHELDPDTFCQTAHLELDVDVKIKGWVAPEIFDKLAKLEKIMEACEAICQPNYKVLKDTKEYQTALNLLRKEDFDFWNSFPPVSRSDIPNPEMSEGPYVEACEKIYNGAWGYHAETLREGFIDMAKFLVDLLKNEPCEGTIWILGGKRHFDCKKKIRKGSNEEKAVQLFQGYLKDSGIPAAILKPMNYKKQVKKTREED
jgi:hypothetical protein